MGENAVVLVVVGLLLLAMLAAAGEADAKGEPTAYHAALAARHALIERAKSGRDEARVRRWTRRWTRLYGHDVGRWARLCHDVGWPEGAMEMLGYVMWRESRGDPRAINPSSGCAGLLQIHPCHGLGAKALNPRVNLKFSLRLWQRSGWRPWGL